MQLFSLTPRSSSSVARLRDPFSLLDSLFSDLSARPATPLVTRARLDVTERNGSYEIHAELPGAKKDDIEVEVDGACVSISAKTENHAEKKEGGTVLYSERRHESFARTFDLPQAVDSEKASATFEDGVLTLTLPKKDAAKTGKRVPIQ